jgi:hypothetical protein
MRRLLIWALLVWTAVVVGGVVAGAVWGLTGFDCNGGPGLIVMDGPCPISPDPTISESASHAAAGAITLGLGAMAIGFVPAVVFTISAGVLGWILRRLGMIRAVRWAPWMLLAIGAGSSDCAADLLRVSHSIMGVVGSDGANRSDSGRHRAC